MVSIFVYNYLLWLKNFMMTIGLEYLIIDDPLAV